MENPYQTPKAKLADLSYQPIPNVLKVLYWLAGLALGCSVSAGVVALVMLWQDEELRFWSWDQSLLLLLMVFAFYGLVFTFYYFLIFRPLHQRKRSTSRWWSGGLLVLICLWLVTELIPSDEETTSFWIDNIFSILELVFLSIGALLARRPAILQELPN